MSELCPCGFGLTYGECCGRFHRGEANAPTAVALMRSRYVAFVLNEVAYLRETWHPSSRPARLTLPRDRRWTGLDVLATSGGGIFDVEGTVEFAAHYRTGGRDGAQAERSRFVREDGRWFYVAAV
ncbi:YchJ family protein [Pseudofrankia asymbiotica]|uniref:YchJ family protein n=1 Tax=Pseudofrankia asymbiotica TaxID=1834516 RepID=UPI002377DBC5|nr:YchJ family protein [Pseudofrankia asymbiotica]